jgi:hypothetical protein
MTLLGDAEYRHAGPVADSLCDPAGEAVERGSMGRRPHSCDEMIEIAIDHEF